MNTGTLAGVYLRIRKGSLSRSTPPLSLKHQEVVRGLGLTDKAAESIAKAMEIKMEIGIMKSWSFHELRVPLIAM